MEQKADVVLDLEGNAIEGASVEVWAGTGNSQSDYKTPATIYDQVGHLLPNSTVSTGPQGDFAFSAPNGKYVIRVLVRGTPYKTIGPLTFYDPSDDGDRLTFQDVDPSNGSTLIGYRDGSVSQALDSLDSRVYELEQNGSDESTQVDAYSVSADNDVFGYAETVGDVLKQGLGSRNQTLPSRYADGPTAVITGQEYLWCLNEYAFNMQNATPTECPTIFSGDSTTYGVYAQGETMSYNFERECDSAGFSCFRSYNRGHSGEHATSWAAPGGYVEQDIAEFPGMGLYVARWGINDGTGNTTDTPAALSSFETALRGGLAKLRAFKNVKQLAIVLMTPNTISEDPNRNERWCELIQPIIRKAARDYQCCFIDTYQIWRDGRREGIGAWLDNAGAGQGIHPDKYFTRTIAQRLAEVVLDPMRNVAMNSFYNVHGGKLRIAANAQPYVYPFGLSYYRTSADGWPFQGFVRVDRSADNITKMTLIGFGSNLLEKSITRYALGFTTWGQWRGETSITCLNGWNFISGKVSPFYFKSDDGLIHVEANLTGANKTSDIAFQLPVGCRRLTSMPYLCCDLAGNIGTVLIDAAGNATINKGSMTDLSQVYISFTYHPYQ